MTNRWKVSVLFSDSFYVLFSHFFLFFLYKYRVVIFSDLFGTKRQCLSNFQKRNLQLKQFCAKQRHWQLQQVTCHTNATINSIGGVMVSVLTSSSVNRGLEPRSGQTKDYKTGFGASSLSTQHSLFTVRIYVPTFSAWQWKKRVWPIYGSYER
jgi:hypothetical protein